MSKTVLFQTIQFRLSTLSSSVWPIDRTLSGDNTPSPSGPGSDGNGGVHRIPQSLSFTWTSLSDCLMSYPGHLFGGVLPLCRNAVGEFCSPSQLYQIYLDQYTYMCIYIYIYIYETCLYKNQLPWYILINVYIYIYRHIYINICTHSHTHTHTHTYICVCVCVCVYIYIYIWYTIDRVYICIYICLCVFVCVCTYTYTHSHTYIHTYIYICVYVCVSMFVYIYIYI